MVHLKITTDFLKLVSGRIIRPSNAEVKGFTKQRYLFVYR